MKDENNKELVNSLLSENIHAHVRNTVIGLLSKEDVAEIIQKKEEDLSSFEDINTQFQDRSKNNPEVEITGRDAYSTEDNG